MIYLILVSFFFILIEVTIMQIVNEENFRVKSYYSFIQIMEMVKKVKRTFNEKLGLNKY